MRHCSPTLTPTTHAGQLTRTCTAWHLGGVCRSDRSHRGAKGWKPSGYNFRRKGWKRRIEHMACYYNRHFQVSMFTTYSHVQRNVVQAQAACIHYCALYDLHEVVPLLSIWEERVSTMERCLGEEDPLDNATQRSPTMVRSDTVWVGANTVIAQRT